MCFVAILKDCAQAAWFLCFFWSLRSWIWFFSSLWEFCVLSEAQLLPWQYMSRPMKQPFLTKNKRNSILQRDACQGGFARFFSCPGSSIPTLGHWVTGRHFKTSDDWKILNTSWHLETDPSMDHMTCPISTLSHDWPKFWCQGSFLKCLLHLNHFVVSHSLSGRSQMPMKAFINHKNSPKESPKNTNVKILLKKCIIGFNCGESRAV